MRSEPDASQGRSPVSELVTSDAPRVDASRRSLNLVQNSIALIVAKVSLMGLGFVFWVVAARAFDPSSVGLAAGAVSAVMLCTQLALLGVGSSFITHLPMHRAAPSQLLNGALNLVVIAAFITGVLFLLFSGIFLRQLAGLAHDPLFDVGFVAVAITGTVCILLDQVSTGFRRGDHALVRNVLSGAVTLGHLFILAVFMPKASATAIFATWVTGGFVQATVGYLQLVRSVGGYGYRPALEASITRKLVGVGVPNHLLTLTERVPGFILPIAVTELLSPAQNAHWYTAWMMAWVIYIVPIQVGMTVFAEASAEPRRLAAHLRKGIKTALLLGVLGATAAAALAPFVLELLGPGYAAAAVTPLRILVLAVVPLTLIQTYFAVCRASRRLREALVMGALSSAAATIGAAAAGVAAGLTGMAIAWVVAQSATGIWAAFRLRALKTEAAERHGPALRTSTLDASGSTLPP